MLRNVPALIGSSATSEDSREESALGTVAELRLYRSGVERLSRLSRLLSGSGGLLRTHQRGGEFADSLLLLCDYLVFR